MPATQPARNKSWATRFRERAFKPVDHASFTFFRIAFGSLMVWEVYRYFLHGWIKHHFLDPRLLFTYYGFSWVKPWPGDGMYIHWWALGILAGFITLGFLYRASTLLFFLGVTYCFLLDQATYLNHFYLICLLSFLLIFMPANRTWAIDPLIGLASPSRTIPNWVIWVFRLQFGVVYFYGGIAKLSHDWLHAEPIRAWVIGRTELPVIGRFTDEAWLPYALAYGGLIFDLAIVPLLLWRRTRLPALFLAFGFHILNAHMFNIGVFPWLGAAATTIFLSPDWPRKLARFFRIPVPASPEPMDPPNARTRQNVILVLLVSYTLIQLLVPLRHHLYEGDVNWTYEGHRFSWRMKLHDRDARMRFYVIDPNIGREYVVDPRQYLRPSTARRIGSRPDMLLQFAHYLAAITPQMGPTPLRVEARVLVSLNGRKHELLVKPGVDLAAEPRTLRHAEWLLPATEPLSKEPPVRRRKGDVSGEAPGE